MTDRTVSPRDEREEIELPVTVDSAKYAKHLRRVDELVVTELALETRSSSLSTGTVEPSGSPSVTVELEGLYMTDDRIPPVLTFDDDDDDSDFYPMKPVPASGIVRETFDSVRDRMKDFSARHDDPPRRLVLGTPQVDTLLGFLADRDSYDDPDTLSEWFGVNEVIEVPGPMIHCLTEYPYEQ
jgi:hypothetical protein